jgi:hypothetical protein
MWKVLLLTVVMVMPGGLLVLAVIALARVLADQIARQQPDVSHRWARAAAAVRWRDVWSTVRQLHRP